MRTVAAIAIVLEAVAALTVRAIEAFVAAIIAPVISSLITAAIAVIETLAALITITLEPVAVVAITRLIIVAALLAIIEARLAVLEAGIILPVVLFWPGTVKRARRLLGGALIGLRALCHLDRGQRLHIAAVGLAFVLALIVVAFRFARLAGALALAIGILATLGLAFAVGQNDPIVVFGVLEVILSEHRVARCRRVARHRQVFFSNPRSGARDFSVRTIALVRPRNRVLTLAVVIIVVVAVVVVVILTAPGTAPAMLLSLPHDLPISLLL